MYHYDNEQLDILITGTGRCGTVYAARLLTSAGTHCGHESIFTPRGIKQAKKLLKNRQAIEISRISQDEKWIEKKDIPNIKADSSYMAAPYVQSSIVSNAKIVHLIRNPIMVISSFVLDLRYFSSRDPQDEYQKFIYRQLPILQKPISQIKRAVVYYREWSKMIEDHDDRIVHKVEDGGPHLLEKLEIQHNSNDIYKNDRANSRRRLPRLSMSDFQNAGLLKEVTSLMDKYGYSQSNLATLI